MACIPPWRWRLWGPWPPNPERPAISEAEIKSLAECLAQQRPWLHADANWFAATRALKQKPWRPWIIRFCGAQERSGWDWAILLSRVSIPILLLGFCSAYIVDIGRQQRTITDKREWDVVAAYIQAMQPILLKEGPGRSSQQAELRGAGRALTLVALSQVADSERKSLIIKFLLDSGLNQKPGSLFSLREANLRGANLSETELSGADLRGADLSNADLRGANLSGADLSKANLHAANLSEANLAMARLNGANLGEATLIKARLHKADLGEASLIGARLNRALLSDANLIWATLRRSSFHGARLDRADLSWTDLRGASLTGANLTGANLSWADLRGASLRGADLQFLRWDEKTRWPDRSAFENSRSISERLRLRLSGQSTFQ